MAVGPGTELDPVDDPEDDFDPIDPTEAADEGDDAEDDLPLDGEDDEDEGEDQPAPVNGQPAAPAPQPSRGERRFQAMNERVRAAEQAAAEATRRAEEAERRARGEDFRRQEEERLASMSEGERIEYRVNQRLNAIQFQSWDATDRVTFNDIASRNPAVAALKDEVETLFQERMRSGQPVDRTTIAKFLIGEKALARAPRARAAGQRAAQAGRERNAVRAPASRGDVPRSTQRNVDERAARRARLEDQEI